MQLNNKSKLNDKYKINSREDLREWLMLFGESEMSEESRSFWMILCREKKFEALEEWLSSGLSVIHRDEEGRGWLHYANDFNMPVWLILRGLPGLPSDWWHPDKKGKTPFHEIQCPVLLQSLLMKWWSHGLKWESLETELGRPDETNKVLFAIKKSWKFIQRNRVDK